MSKQAASNRPGTVPDKLKPHNVEAEEALLGAILIDQDALIKIAHLGLTGADFFIERHGWVFDTANELNQSGDPVDLVSIIDRIRQSGRLAEIGGEGFLSRLINRTPSSLHAEYYAKTVHRASVLRQLIRAAGDISQMAFAEDIEAEDALNRAADILLSVSKNNVKIKHRTLEQLGNLLLDRIDQMANCKNGITGFPTSLTDLDKLTSGLQRGDLILLAGRPGMGKSALALQIALEGAKEYKGRTLLFSREMSDESLFQRMVAYDSGIDLRRIRAGNIKSDEYSTFIDTLERLKNLPIVIDSSTSTPEAMRARSIIEQERNGLDLIIVDYIQRVDPPPSRRYQNRVTEVGAVSSLLKNLALDLDLPVLAISSLSRNCEMRADKRPTLSDLRESGDLEYDADEVLFIYRDEVYNSNTEYPNVAEIDIAKQRQGPLGMLSVYFKKHLTKFVDLEVNVQPMDWVK